MPEIGCEEIQVQALSEADQPGVGQGVRLGFSQCAETRRTFVDMEP